jgi:broad specificity phosphatase PhoE
VEITFVRHAQSEANVAGRWQGHGDAALSEEGREQARALAHRFAGHRFDRVVASDLSRAADTARGVSAQVSLDPRWREVDVGAWEGLTREEVLARFPDEVRALQRGENVPIGGGESWLDLLHRVRSALDDLKAQMAEGERALVVSHGGVIHALVSSLMRLDDRRPRPIGRVTNTAATTVRFEGSTCELATFNDASHLGPVGSWTRERLDAGDAVLTCVGSETVAERVGVTIAGRANGDFQAAVESTARRHPGQRMGLLCKGADVAAYASMLFGHGAVTQARIAAPAPEGWCHVVVSRVGPTLADYNLCAD